MTLIDFALPVAGLVAGIAIDAGAARYAGAPSWTALGRTAILTGLAGAVIAVAALTFSDPEVIAFSVIFGWLLLALSAADFRTYLLPDALNVAVLALGAVMVAVDQPSEWVMHVAGAVAGFGLLWSVEAFYRKVRGRDGLGRGDAKLLGAIGLWVSVSGLPLVLLIASLSGIAFAVVLALIGKQKISGQSELAFGPWIALAGFGVWLWSMQDPGAYPFI